MLMTHSVSRLAGLLFALVCVGSNAFAQSNTPTLSFVVKHRVNAHGDEYNALARTSDGQFAIIGTEKGDVIVWSFASQKIERTFHQPSAVHFVVTLRDPRFVVAAGSNHHSPRVSLVRKWNITDGTFTDLPGLPADSFPTALAADNTTGLLALGVADGILIVWDLATSKVVTSFKTDEVPLALGTVARHVYVAGINWETLRSEREPTENAIVRFSVDQPNTRGKEFLKITGRLWDAIEASPDQSQLVASYQQKGSGKHTVLIEPQTGAVVSSFEGSDFAWINPTSFVRFEGFDPAAIVELNGNDKVSTVRKFGRMASDTLGRAFELSGQLANRDGTKAWAVYRKGPGFLEFDLKAQKIKTILGGPSGAYAISVSTKDYNEGVLATGGADGYVRLWNMSDLAMTREYHVAPYDSIVTDVDLLADGRRAVVGMKRKAQSIEDQYKDPVHVLVLDLANGTMTRLFEMPSWLGGVSVIDKLVLYPNVDRMKLVSAESASLVREFVVKGPISKSMVSANRKLLAVLDEGKALTVFEVATGRKVSSKLIEPGEYGPMAITNDGHYIHQVAPEGTFLTWNTQTGEMTKHDLTRIHSMHTNVDFITLANDDQWLVTAGNHGDVGIFERATGKLVCYEESRAAAFYAEKAWVGGDRLIFTTDTGVMFDGRLVKAAQAAAP